MIHVSKILGFISVTKRDVNVFAALILVYRLHVGSTFMWRTGSTTSHSTAKVVTHLTLYEFINYTDNTNRFHTSYCLAFLTDRQSDRRRKWRTVVKADRQGKHWHIFIRFYRKHAPWLGRCWMDETWGTLGFMSFSVFRCSAEYYCVVVRILTARNLLNFRQ